VLFSPPYFQIAKFEENLKEKNDLLTCFKENKVRINIGKSVIEVKCSKYTKYNRA